jgi:CRP-like cAMP-binding protein/N-acyl-L-homoserine lactone synthetase
VGVRIKLATTTEELDELFQVRHRVFVREKRYVPPQSEGRLFDRFDTYPTTANIVAIHQGHVVGGVRIVEPSSCGAPADHFFDFHPYLPEGAIVGSGSMLVMDEEFRRVPRVTFAMLGMMYYWALCKGLTHITGVAAPEAEKLFIGSGYRPVTKRFYHEPTELFALPVMLNIVELNDRFSEFVGKHQFRHFLQSFERQFHQKGETIIRRGEAGTTAYVIIEGRVAALMGRSMAPPPAEVANLIPPPPRMAADLTAPIAPPPGSQRPGLRPDEPVDNGPISVRNPARMNDRGRMTEPPITARAGSGDDDSPLRQRSMNRTNEVPKPLRNPVVTGSEGPISSRRPSRLSAPPVPPIDASGVPSSKRTSVPPSARTQSPLSVRYMSAGEVFGELALITSQPRSADVVAVTDVDLMVIERDAFLRQVSQNPEVALNMLAVIGERLVSVTDRLVEVADMYAEDAESGDRPVDPDLPALAEPHAAGEWARARSGAE